MKRSLLVLMLIGLWLAACSTPGGPVIVPTEIPPTQVPPTGTHIPVDIPAAQREAMKALAAALGIGVDEIKLVSLEAVQWPDGCLGVVLKGVMCTQVVVPGFRVVLEANGQQYEYHTNQDASVVIAAPAGGGHIPVDIPAAAREAMKALSDTLGLSVDQITLVSSEAVEWPDRCLGVRRMGVLCAQGIVPGFRIVLEANGQQYEYHTNQDGSVVVQAPAGTGGADTPAIPAAIEALAQVLGVKETDITLVSDAALEWPDSCLGLDPPGLACSQIVTPGFLVVLEVNGQQYEYRTNGDGSVVMPATVALTWQRQGGIAGFCDTLVIYRAGEAHGSSCTGGAGPGVWDQTLTDAQRSQMNQWLAQYEAVTAEHSNPGTDVMTVTLTLAGQGTGQPTDAEQQAIEAWAQDVYTGIQR